jgi:muramoyltetrapeptide carboxypeptidase
MLWNLKRGGKLDHLAGLIIGGFRHKPSEDPAEEFALTVADMVLEKIPRGRYPVCFGFPVGHQKNNMALLHGALHQLTVTNKRTILTALR